MTNANQAIRLTRSVVEANCIHYYVIERSDRLRFRMPSNGNILEGVFTPNGTYSPGVCVYNAEMKQGGCGMRKRFRNTTPESNQLT